MNGADNYQNGHLNYIVSLLCMDKEQYNIDDLFYCYCPAFIL